ncbi:MAG TPA: RodZ domain-containing protein [Gaiellaceae bacterium]|nr:RodZ domain-containing protein [Gaiellaceae bacterium]
MLDFGAPRVGDRALLEERLLREGESVTLTGARIWLNAGAAANVDLTVNGAARELEPGAVAVLLSPT